MVDVDAYVRLVTYQDLKKILGKKYGYNVSERVVQQMLEETGGFSGDVAEQVNWLGRFFKANDTPYEVASEVGRTMRYASGKSTGIYSITETGSVSTSVIESTSTELATVESAFGTEIIEYEGANTVSLSSVGNAGTSAAGKIGDYIVGELAPKLGAVAVGTLLGVAVDTILYNANPNYWDEKLPTLNPETWDDIILGHDTKIPFLHNIRTGKSYINENMLAYTSLFGYSDGWFTSGEYDEKTDPANVFNGYSAGVSKTFLARVTDWVNGVYYNNIPITVSGNAVFTSLDNGSGTGSGMGLCVDHSDVTCHISFTLGGKNIICPIEPSLMTPFASYTYNNKRVDVFSTTTSFTGYVGQEYDSVYRFETVGKVTDYLPVCIYPIPTESSWAGKLGYIALYGSNTIHHKDKPAGISIMGRTPNMSGVTNIDSAKTRLRTTYPDLYNNALDVPFVNEDGTTSYSKWLPAPLPTNSEKPTNENYEQTDDGSYPDEDIQNEVNEDIVTPTVIIPTPTNPINPIDPVEPTPTPVIPDTPTSTGLGAVYIPTIAQLKSFSAWLWSDNFIDQIKKLFSDPMQAIIGLHQIYFTPTISGADTIHTGYLDSGVDSNYTEVRYYNVDCGSINIGETFGNVFDYDPYTTIEIYLPFIGIVPLKVGDVMRSTINVVYTCDVLTGACLCNIYVIRDGARCVLYTYGGNCAVNYPLSSGSYMGIVSALAGVGLSVGTAIATGGASIPLSLGGGAISMLNAHTNVKTSGGYGGNTGAMGIKKPYIILKNTLSAMPNNYNKYIGNPFNNTILLKNCNGFTQANTIHLIGSMTSEEKNEILNLFSNGVII